MNAHAFPVAPKTLGDPLVLDLRRKLLADAPHLAPLRLLLDRMRATHGTVPDPDPLDGGAFARVLVLLETPGTRVMRTGFVSRDNPAGTAANLFRFLAEAGLPRRETLLWNAVPFLIHDAGAANRAPDRAETRAGHAWLAPLLDLMPQLRAIVCAGRFAQAAVPMLRQHRPDVAIIPVPHPSPTYVCTNRLIATRIAAGLREAREVCERSP